MKKFGEFLNLEKEISTPKEEDISESSFLSKGYSIIQGNRHIVAAKKLKTSTSRIRSITSRGRSEQIVSKKIDFIYDTIDELSHALEHNATMSTAHINATVAGAVLGEDVKKELTGILAKLKRK